MRRIHLAVAVSAVAALAAAALTGCASSSSTACTPTAPGSASSAVSVTGDFGTALSLTATTPIASPTTTQRSVLIQGKSSGPVATDGMQADIFYTVWDGQNGQLIESGLDSSAYPVTIPVDSTQIIAGFYDTLKCATPGTRVVGVIPPSEGLGDSGSQVGLGQYDSLILVADVESVEPYSSPSPTPVPSIALPTPAAWTTGVPAVDLTANPPTVTIPDSAPPADLELAVLQAGSGGAVPNGATVTVDYTGIDWASKQAFDSSLDPAFGHASPASFPTNGVVPGFAAAIVGQQVGSWVIVTMPPADGYGANPPSGQEIITADSTLVFLVHIESYS